jgi:hypothetical protein
MEIGWPAGRTGVALVSGGGGEDGRGCRKEGRRLLSSLLWMGWRRLPLADPDAERPDLAGRLLGSNEPKPDRMMENAETSQNQPKLKLNVITLE